MKIAIGYRKAKRTDIEFLLTLRKASMSEHLTRAGINMSDEQHTTRVMEFFTDSHIILRNNETVGVIKLGVFPASLHIRQFQILPLFHNEGIGSCVINVIKKQAIKLLLPITLNVLIENPAKALYLRHGFYVTDKNSLEYQMRWDHKEQNNQ